MPSVKRKILEKSPEKGVSPDFGAVLTREKSTRLALAKLLRKLGLIGKIATSDAAMIRLVDDFCSPPNVSGTPLTGPRDVSVTDDRGGLQSITSEPREDLDSTIPF